MACRQTGRQAGIGATPSRYPSGQALEKGNGCLSRRIAGGFLDFSRKDAKPQRNLTALLFLGSRLLLLDTFLIPYFACPPRRVFPTWYKIRSTGLLAESIHVAKRIDIFPPLPSSHCFRHWRACRMSYFVFPTLYFVLGTLYFLMPNAQCRMMKWEILPMKQFRTSYLVFPTLYFVHGTLYYIPPTFVLTLWG